MPMALAPSVCPGSMEMMPPRTLSAMYAPVFMETMSIAAAHMLSNLYWLLEK